MITTRQVMELFCMILAGCICSKTGAIKVEAKKAFSDLLLYLVVPAMVVHSYMTEFDEKILANLVLTLIRMVLVPAICFVVFRVIGAGSMVAEVVLLLEACPCAAITSVFAVQYGYHEDLAAGTVVVSTLLSIVTLPICAMLLTVLM